MFPRLIVNAAASPAFLSTALRGAVFGAAMAAGALTLSIAAAGVRNVVEPSTTTSQLERPRIEQQAGQRDLHGELADLHERLATSKATLGDARLQADNATHRRAEQNAQRDSLAVADMRFFYRDEKFGSRQPVLSLKLTNKGPVALTRVTLEATLKTPGRSVPWVTGSFEYEIAGGLEPYETQTVELTPYGAGEWGKVKKDVVEEAVLAVKVMAIEDARGKHVDFKGEGLGDAARKATDRQATLEGVTRDLSDRIATVTAQLDNRSTDPADSRTFAAR